MTLNDWCYEQGLPQRAYFSSESEIQLESFESLGPWDGDLPEIDPDPEGEERPMCTLIGPGFYAGPKRTWPHGYFDVEVIEAVPEEGLVALRVHELSYDGYDAARGERRYHYRIHEKRWVDLDEHTTRHDPDSLIWHGIVSGGYYDELWKILHTP